MRLLPALTLGAVLASSLSAEDPDFLSHIDSTSDFFSVTLPSTTPFASRVGKYLLPARVDPALLGPTFQNVNTYRFHFEFLTGAFPDRFPGLTFEAYLDLVMERATRDYYAGTLTQYHGPEGLSYGFTVLTNGADPTELLTAEEVRAVYDRLQEVFALEPLEYAPQRAAAILAARGWENPGFPLRGVGGQALPQAIGYTPATNYGVVRRYTLEELTAAEQSGELDRQTIVVVDEAPADIDTAIAGLVTATLQGELSHLATRLTRRQVPNAFVRDALAGLAPYEGQIVRLEVSLDNYSVAAATLEEAEIWWDEHRPKLPPIPTIDDQYSDLDRITEVDLTGGATAVLRRFGGKAAGLAVLYRYLPARYQTPGFAIPFRHYVEFMRSNTTASLVTPEVQVSYETFVTELLADERFRSDGAFRRTSLNALRDEIREHGVVPKALTDTLRDRILEVFEDPDVKVRFRSSSNSEDSVEMTGAGLYDSTSVCLPDELDGDASGPSLCDVSKSKERTIERALKKVWASLWNHRAFEEREYFQIDHLHAAMALVVTLAYPDEDTNGVLFTGDPANPDDRRYVVNVQLGDQSVVSPGVGIESEKDLLVMDETLVRKIVRVRSSSLVVPDQQVLTDLQLVELGSTLGSITGDFLSHYDLGEHSPENVLLDFEFKFQDGQLIVKQARPFLLGAATSSGSRFVVEVAPSLTICTQFADDRAPYDEYRLKSRITFAERSVELLSRSVHVVANVIDELEFGPEGQVLEPLESGLFELEVRDSAPRYSWVYTQSFNFDGRPFQVRFEKTFHESDGDDGVFRWVIDENAIENSFLVFGQQAGSDSVQEGARYGSCQRESLPLWNIDAVFEGGDSVHFVKRYQEPFAGSGPALLISGDARLGGVEYNETSYWRLVYAADHHNFNEEFVQVFDPPITVGETAGVGGLYLLEAFRDNPPAAALLDPNFNVLRTLEVLSYSEELFGSKPHAFTRGSVNADGSVDLSDAGFILRYLFLGSGDPACLKSADTNDSGSIDVTDAIYLLGHLFLGGSPPPPPYPDCGSDPTVDSLECAEPPECTVFDGIRLEIAPNTKLFSIWSEGFDTTDDQHAVLSVIELRAGKYDVFSDRDTEGLRLIESLSYGSELAPAEAIDDGTFFHRPNDFFPLEYRQSFATPAGPWTFTVHYRPGEVPSLGLDCALLDAETRGESQMIFFAELESPAGRRRVHYSCLLPSLWTPTRFPESPLRLELEDETTLELHLEETYFFRGVAGETSNRYLSQAAVNFRGRSFDIRSHQQLIYAGLHHNWQQQYRILFDNVVEGVAGIDIVDCPTGTSPPCLASTVAGMSKAYLLDETLKRTTELTVTQVGFGTE